MMGLLMNNKLESMCEWPAYNIKVLSQYLPRGSKENREILSQYADLMGLDLKLAPLRYEVELLICDHDI